MSIEKYTLNIGINEFSNSQYNLSGCVNDANDWSYFLGARGYKQTTLVDEAATRMNVLVALQDHVARLGYRDRLVVTFSTHGSYQPDYSGDEEDGKDEVLVMHHMDYITDDELFDVFSRKAYGSRITVLSDSCHSGSVGRFAGLEPSGQESRGKKRWISPDVLTEVPDAKTHVRGFTPASNSLLISGCDDPEFSYDAWFGDRANGAFTRTAIDTFQDGMTYAQWHAAIRAVLPSDQYPQSPQIQGTRYQQTRWVALD